MDQSALVNANATKPLSLRQLMPFILVFLYGFMIGGFISIFLLEDQLKEAWVVSAQLSTSPNVPLFNLMDDLVGYYMIYGLIFLVLIVVSIWWKFVYTPKK